MSPALGTNGDRSKSTTVFMHFCIECNGKSLQFDKGRFKSQLYMQNTIFFLITNLKVIYFVRFGDITKRDGISTYNLR